MQLRSDALQMTAYWLLPTAHCCSAHIAEGYSRASDKDQARFYEYALGSARESRDWYYKARHVLDEATISERHALFARIIRILLVVVRNHRGKSLREASATYDYTGNDE